MDIHVEQEDAQVHFGLLQSFLETLVNNIVVLYLRASGDIACYKQEFRLSKTSHGLDEAVLDFL